MSNELRYELKFVTDQIALAQVRSWIRLHPEGFRPTFTPRTVNSVYLDTPKLSHLDDNLLGSRQRQKIRLRWYGDLSDMITEPILELKLKDGYLGDKKRTPLANLSLKQTWSQIMKHIRQEANAQYAAVWQNRLHPFLTPTILNRYKRDYFVSPDGQLRLTLDYNQQVFNQRLSSTPNIQFPQNIASLVVIEMKAPPELSDRLETAASHIPIRRNRNSKYVNAVLSTLR